MPYEAYTQLACTRHGHVSWRCANVAGPRTTPMYSDISATDQRTLVVGNSSSASTFASSVLPTPVGPRKKKRPEAFGSAGYARVTDCCSNCGNSVVLANNAQVELVFKVLELVIALHHLGHRNAGPRRNYFSNLIRDLYMRIPPSLLGERAFSASSYLRSSSGMVL